MILICAERRLQWKNNTYLTSWNKCAFDMSSNLVLSITFTATFSPVNTCRANFTTAKCPDPKVSSRSYSPATVVFDIALLFILIFRSYHRIRDVWFLLLLRAYFKWNLPVGSSLDAALLQMRKFPWNMWIAISSFTRDNFSFSKSQ
jgi:hypothetical protein